MNTCVLGGALLGLASFALAGVGCTELVSSREYVDDSMSEYHYAAYADRDSSVYGYLPSERPAEPRVTVIPHSQGQPTVYGRDGEPIRESGYYEGVVTPGMRTAYASDVRNELEALEREMRKIEARAELRGAPALAAIDPKVRDFETSRQAIENRMAASDDWAEATADIDVSLEDARNAVRQAAEVVQLTPSPTRD